MVWIGGLLHVEGKAVHRLAGEISLGSQATTANDMRHEGLILWSGS